MSALLRENLRWLILPGAMNIEGENPGSEMDVQWKGSDLYVLARKNGAPEWRETVLASSAEIDDGSWRKTVSERLVTAVKSALKE